MTPVLIPIINGTVEIPLSLGKVAVIDVEDYSLVSKHKWHANPSGKTFYAMTRRKVGRHGRKWGVIRFDERKISLHEYLMGAKEGFEIDHIDRDGLNNRRSNLRYVSRQQQMCNTGPRAKKRLSDSIAKYKGVVEEPRRKTGNRWVATITIPGKKQKYLGSFYTPEEAAAAFNAAAIEHYGEFAYLNPL